jgi:hypothetical protein
MHHYLLHSGDGTRVTSGVKSTKLSSSNGNGWKVTRERILLFSGLFIIVFMMVNSEVFGNPFHFEFLLAALALCGVSITQWGDKK